jgi:hypothetical protein
MSAGTKENASRPALPTRRGSAEAEVVKVPSKQNIEVSNAIEVANP